MARPKREDPLIPVLIRFDRKLYDRLKAYAAETNKPVAHVIAELVDRPLGLRGH